MIRGVHAMFYSSKADPLRDFIKDKLKLPYTDVGCHPTGGVEVQIDQPKYAKRVKQEAL